MQYSFKFHHCFCCFAKVVFIIFITDFFLEKKNPERNQLVIALSMALKVVPIIVFHIHLVNERTARKHVAQTEIINSKIFNVARKYVLLLQMS